MIGGSPAKSGTSPRITARCARKATTSQLTGNVRVTGPPQGGVEPLSLTTESLRINTPTEFIETDAPVKLRWSGHELDAVGMRADLKAGTLSLESDVNGHFQPK